MNANSLLTIHNWLKKAHGELKTAGVESYSLDSLVLLEHVSGHNKAHILTHPNKELPAKEIKALDSMLTRRANREPLAYITGVKEFYGRNFYVNKTVLIPRPESESFIELLKKYRITHQNIIDVGSGSGVIGVTIKLELPTNNVTLSDISHDALATAKRNAEQLQATCQFRQLYLLPDSSQFTVVLANLPYVPKDMSVQPELSHEPPIALFAGNKGLALYEQLWQQVTKLPKCTYVLTESLQGQHDRMILLALEANYQLVETDGLVQMFKRR